MSVEILLERETANDETALVVKIHVVSGMHVEKDTLLFEIENSKAVQEIWSTSDGILLHALASGQEVNFGLPIARILTREEWEKAGDLPVQALKPTRSSEDNPLSVPSSSMSGRLGASEHIVLDAPAVSLLSAAELPAALRSAVPLPPRLTQPRMSQAAATLVAEHPIDVAKLPSDFITTRVILEHLAGRKLDDGPAVTSSTADHPIAINALPEVRPGREVERRKRLEIDTLLRGAGNTMLSVLGVLLGPMQIPRTENEFLTGRITDLVIYEASRLMKLYPNLNASYTEDRVVAHPDVHAGLAIDSGSRLVVYGIEHADCVSIPDLGAEISGAVERYMSNTLTSAEVSRATFTITDLSADELDFVFPLLPRGQSCILGITHSSAAGYRIFAGFDHRVTEGREVSSFLGELRERLISFASLQKKVASDQPHCGFCGRSTEEAFRMSKDLGFLTLTNRDGNEYFCCATCWNGW